MDYSILFIFNDYWVTLRLSPEQIKKILDQANYLEEFEILVGK